MYIPTHFEQPSIEVMHELIRSRPLATLVTISSNGINANHIPLDLKETPYRRLVPCKVTLLVQIQSGMI